VPKEHGASFISVHSLLLGIVAGFAAGGDDLAGLAIAIAFGILFLPLAAAISTITHRRLRSVARRRAATLGAAFAVAGATALAHGPTAELLGLGAMAAGLGLAYAAARQTTGPRAIPTQLAAIAGICLFAPLAWLLVAGPTDRWPLAGIAGFLAFGGTVPYVRERVRRRRVASATLAARLRGGRLALAWQAVALGAAAAAAWAGLVHWLAAAAFVPGAVKTVLGLARPETKPPIARIGYVETAISTVFAVLAGVGLGVAP
jgi:4-hydroxybenzoate polyprenyltransferase